MAEDMNLYVDVKVHTWEELIDALKTANSNYYGHNNTDLGHYIIDIVEDIDCQGIEVIPTEKGDRPLFTLDDCYSVLRLAGGASNISLVSTKRCKIKNLTVKRDTEDTAKKEQSFIQISPRNQIIGLTFENLHVYDAVTIINGNADYISILYPMHVLDCSFDITFHGPSERNNVDVVLAANISKCVFKIGMADDCNYAVSSPIIDYCNFCKECIVYMKGYTNGIKTMFYNDGSSTPLRRAPTLGGTTTWKSERNALILENVEISASANSQFLNYNLYNTKDCYVAVINCKVVGEDNEGKVNCKPNSIGGAKAFIDDSVKDRFEMLDYKNEDIASTYIFNFSDLKDPEKLIANGFFTEDWQNYWEFDDEFLGLPVPKIRYSTSIKDAKNIYLGGSNVYEVYMGNDLLWSKKDLLNGYGCERLFYIRHWRIPYEKAYLVKTFQGSGFISVGDDTTAEVEFTVNPLNADNDLLHVDADQEYLPILIANYSSSDNKFSYLYSFCAISYDRSNFRVYLGLKEATPIISSGPGNMKTSSVNKWTSNNTERLRVSLYRSTNFNGRGCATIRSNEYDYRNILASVSGGSVPNSSYLEDVRYSMGKNTDYSAYNIYSSCFYYGFKIYCSNFLAVDLIPAYNKNTGKVGWFDMVNKTFDPWDADGTGQQSGLDFAGPYPGSDLYKEIQEKNKQ